MEKFFIETKILGKYFYFTGIADGIVHLSTDVTKAILFESYGRAKRKAKKIESGSYHFSVGSVLVNVRIA